MSNIPRGQPVSLDWVLPRLPMARRAEVAEIAPARRSCYPLSHLYATGAILDVGGGRVSP
jgi:hypothetical protein